MNFRNLIILIFSSLLASTTLAGMSELEEYIRKKIPDATIKTLEAQDHFKETIEVKFKQPLDHSNPKNGSFEHRIFISHVDRKSPMLFVTEGYSAEQTTYELSKILQSNQIIVEYRFNGESRPDTIPWKYLTNDQAVEDLHRIRKIFRKFYKKKWVSTGISKGGTTTLIYKSKYPRDVKAAVAYVAPLAFASEDKRANEFQKKAGSEDCRNKIIAFQRAVLEKRALIIPRIEDYGKKKNLVFSIGLDVVLEYAALEFPFSFWQWGGHCDGIPDKTASAEELFDYVEKVVSWSFYSDRTVDYFLPAFYQFKTELGYYGFPTEHVKDLLIAVKEPSSLSFVPNNVNLEYKPYLVSVYAYLMQKGDKIIYIYGELDTWTACGITPSPKTDALKMILKGGSHTTRINSFPKKEQKQIYDKLEQWLKIEVDPI